MKADKQSILPSLQAWLDNMQQENFEAEDMQEYMDRIFGCPEQGKLH